MNSVLCTWLLAGFLGAQSPAGPTRDLGCFEVDGGLELYAGGKLVLRYNTAVVEPPPGVDPVYSRSGHIHPLNTPSGKTLTAEFPLDHVHQHGVFFAWVNCEFEGRHVDFWNQAKRTGRIEHVRVNRIDNQPDYAGFSVTLYHIDLTSPAGPNPVLEEEWTVRTYRPAAEGFIVDVTSRQTCIAHSPLVLLEYHYGGFAFRGNSEWLGQSACEFLTSEGKTRIEGNHTRPNWVNLQGQLDGEPCGLTIFCHPGNLRAPQPVRLHPSKPYFVFTPPVLGEHKIFPGESLTSQYRILTHDGPADAARDNRLWEAFALPAATPAQ